MIADDGKLSKYSAEELEAVYGAGVRWDPFIRYPGYVEYLGEDKVVDPFIFLDEKGRTYPGYPGWRTRPGRTGYDPLDTYYELAFVSGMFIRKVIDEKLYPRNPLALLYILIFPILLLVPFDSCFLPFQNGYIAAIIFVIGLLMCVVLGVLYFIRIVKYLLDHE